jgi:predicted transcriptional regulator
MRTGDTYLLMMYRFGDALSRALRVRGLTIQELARLAGVAPATASAAVNGRAVQITSATRIARAVREVRVVSELETWIDNPELE